MKHAKLGKKQWIGIVLAAVVILGALMAKLLLGSGSADTGGVFVQQVSTLNYASFSQMLGINHYNGVVETQKTEKVDFDTTKKLDQLLVSEEQHVEKGDPLFSYDIQSMTLDIEQKNLEIEQLNTTITNDTSQISQLQTTMNKVSADEKLSYSSQILQLQAEVAQAQYDIETKKNEVLRLQTQVDNAVVTAPMAGTIESIAEIDAENGVITNDEDSTASSGSGDNTYITIVGDGDLRIKGKISEQNIAEIYANMPVLVISRVDETITWSGTISSIETKASTESNDGYYMSSGEQDSNYGFYINLDSIDGLRLGQHVLIEPDYGQGEEMEGIWIDEGYIQVDEDGSSYVWATSSDGGKLEKRVIEVGKYSDTMYAYEIVSGLSESDYLAWPDETCVAGAKTTTTFLFEEDELADDVTVEVE